LHWLGGRCDDYQNDTRLTGLMATAGFDQTPGVSRDRSAPCCALADGQA
jgi:hypothetical protein